MPPWLERPLAAVDRAFLFVAQSAIALMMIAVSCDALGRYLFNRPLQGTYEFVSLYLMVAITFLGMPGVYARGGQIRLDALGALLAAVPGRIPERINALVGCAVFAVAAWVSTGVAVEKFVERDATFGVISFPLYLSYCWVPLGAILLTARLAAEVAWPQSPAAGHAPAQEIEP